MKRNLDLVRNILLALEESNDFQVPVDSLLESLSQYDRREVLWNVLVLEDAGLVTLRKIRTDSWLVKPEDTIDAVRISWAGHEFLAAAMNDSVWNGAKKLAGEMFRSASLATLNALMQQVIRSQVPGL